MSYARLSLALAGFAAALLAIAFEERWLGWGAIALLASSVLVRLWRRRTPPDDGTPEA